MRLPFMALVVCGCMVLTFWIGTLVEAWFDLRTHEAAYQRCLVVENPTQRTECIVDLIERRSRRCLNGC